MTTTPLSDPGNLAACLEKPAQTSTLAADPADLPAKQTSVWKHFRFLWVAVFVGFALLEYGFDNSEIAGFQAMVGFLKVFGYEDPTLPSGWNIKSGPQQMIASFVLLGTFVASLLAGLIGKCVGRRHSIMLGSVILVVGVTLQIVTTSIRVLYFARIVTGLANGTLMNFAFLYVAETSPAHLRGLAYGLSVGWVTLGSALGYAITYGTEKLDSRLSYQVPLYTLYLIPLAMCLGLPWLPETPRWLLLRGKQDEALKALTWIRHGAYSRAELLQEYEEMRLNVQHEIQNQANVHFYDMFNKQNIRRTLISCGVGLINPGVGGMFAMTFLTYFFAVVGVEEPFKWVIMAQFLGYFGQVVSYYFVGILGRRTMMLIGASICCLSNLVLGIIFQAQSVTDVVARGKATVFLMSFYLFGFNFGIVPMVYLVSGEIPAQNLRAYTAGLSIGVGFVFAWLTAFTAPYFINPADLDWGGRYGFIWFGSTVLAIVFIFFCVPEVKGRSLEEIEEMFDKGISARGFSTYVCENVKLAKVEAERELILEEAKDGRGKALHVEINHAD